MTKGWFKGWWTMALLTVGLAGIVIYDVWRVVGILAEPVVDWWDLLGPCLGGIWLALLATETARRAVGLYRVARPAGGDAQAGH